MIASAKMKLAFTLLSSGLFKETLDELGGIDVQIFNATDKSDYYFLKARSYFDLSDYDRSPAITAVSSAALGIRCIDSAIALNQPGTFRYLELKGLRDLRTGNYTDGETTYVALLKLPALMPHDFAVNACCLSYIYTGKRSAGKIGTIAHQGCHFSTLNRRLRKRWPFTSLRIIFTARAILTMPIYI